MSLVLALKSNHRIFQSNHLPLIGKTLLNVSTFKFHKIAFLTDQMSQSLLKLNKNRHYKLLSLIGLTFLLHGLSHHIRNSRLFDPNEQTIKTSLEERIAPMPIPKRDYAEFDEPYPQDRDVYANPRAILLRSIHLLFKGMVLLNFYQLSKSIAKTTEFPWIEFPLLALNSLDVIIQLKDYVWSSLKDDLKAEVLLEYEVNQDDNASAIHPPLRHMVSEPTFEDQVKMFVTNLKSLPKIEDAAFDLDVAKESDLNLEDFELLGRGLDDFQVKHLILIPKNVQEAKSWDTELSILIQGLLEEKPQTDEIYPTRFIGSPFKRFEQALRRKNWMDEPKRIYIVLRSIST